MPGVFDFGRLGRALSAFVSLSFGFSLLLLIRQETLLNMLKHLVCGDMFALFLP